MVTVYTKTTCQPCKATKRALTKKGISFEEINVELNPDARERVIALGFSQLPVVISPMGNWSGFEPDKIGALGSGGE